MARGSSVDYNPVPSVENVGSLGGGQTVHASAQDFGSQVGTAAEDAGNKAFELAQKQQGMINDTLMTNSDADFATKVGKIKGDYQTLTGMAAYTAFPKYQNDIRSAFQESRAGLPPAAQRGFDMMAARSMANHMADGSSYASGQLKEANRDAYSNVENANIQALLDPSIASDPARSQYHLDSIKYATHAQIDDEHPGLKTGEDGSVSFDESTPEGKSGKAELQRQTDIALSQGYVNKYHALISKDVGGAYKQYQEERDKMPRSAQVALDSTFSPKIFDAHKQTAAGNTLNEAAQEHWDTLTNPDKQQTSKIADAIFTQESGRHFGGQVSSSGAMGGAQIMPATFDQYAKDGEDINNPEDNKAVGERIIADYTKKYDGDAARVAVAYFSGPGNVAPAGSPTPWLKDKADSDGKSVSSYVSDVTARVGGQSSKTYAMNENGGPLSLADYYRTNSQQILAKGDAYAEQQMPGDLALKRAVRQSLSNQMQQVISNENAQHTLDNRNVVKAINGEMTNGKPPETEEELRAIPGMGDLIDNIAARDPKFAETIPTLIAKMAARNDKTNSSNGYGVVMRTLAPYNKDDPNSIGSEDHLIAELGKPLGTGINKKDYNDAKPAIDLDRGLKDALSKYMKEAAIGNGNLDGQGERRALAWYNQAMQAWRANATLGDKGDTPAQFIARMGQSGGIQLPQIPSRAQQIQNLATSLAKDKGKPFDYDTIQPGQQYMAPDGTIRTKQ